MNSPIQNAQGETLDYVFHGDAADKSQLVIIGHGVTGDCGRPWAIALAEALAEKKIPALRFSFSGNGESEGTFRDSTISKEVADLKSVIDAAKTAGYETITYAGHSQGGAVGVLAAAEDERINQLISLAGMVHTAKFYEVEFGEVTPDTGNMWDDQDCPLSQAYADDMKAINSVIPQGTTIQIPWLLIHGTADDVVPIEESREIFAAAIGEKELVELEGCNHVFADEGLQPMIEAVLEWLE